MFYLYRCNKKILLILILLITINLNVWACKKNELDEEDKIIAKVNDDVITQKEFDDEFDMLKKMYEKQLGGDVLYEEVEDGKSYQDILADNLLESMILEKLIVKEMHKLDIAVTDGEIEEEIKSRYIDGLGGEEKYKMFLQENSFTEEFLRSGIRKSLMDQKYKADFFNKIKLSEDELKRYYDSHKDSLIQVKISMIQLESQEDGHKLLERLDKGEDFHQLATIKSIDPVSAAEGGNLGYLTRDTFEYPYQLKDMAFALDEGEISNLIEDESGYYIILVEDRKEEYEDLKEDIVAIVKNEKYADKLSKLKADAEVKKYIKSKSRDK